MHDLIGVIAEGNAIVSPPEAAQNVVEVLSGFVLITTTRTSHYESFTMSGTG